MPQQSFGVIVAPAPMSLSEWVAEAKKLPAEQAKLRAAWDREHRISDDHGPEAA